MLKEYPKNVFFQEKKIIRKKYKVELLFNNKNRCTVSIIQKGIREEYLFTRGKSYWPK